MDRLADAVAAAVAGAADRRDDASVTFGRVRALADQAAGTTPRATAALDPNRARPPRLTEPWFC
jgi:hypothetical protein